MRTRISTPLTALVTIPLALALMTGCSAGSAGTGDTTPSASEGTYTDLHDWHLAFAECMRGEGIDMPDPDENGRVQATRMEDVELHEKASDTCTAKIGDAPVDPGTEKSPEELKEQALKMAKCFRDAGYDMPDPEDPRALTIPSDVPDDIMQKCMPETATVTKSGVE